MGVGYPAGFLQFDQGAMDTTYARYKPVLEFLITLVLLVLTSPLILLAIIAIKLTSRGPAFYTQKRVGKNGLVFTIYKLRTMVSNSESTCGPVWCKPGDARITRVGRLLRNLHFDELPQFVNVLRGEMSLVGPRPERPEIISHLQATVPHFGERLWVRPGLTGLAQVQLPPDMDLEGVHKKLICDRYYLRHLGLWMDARLVCCTGLLMIGVPLALSRCLLGVPQPHLHPRPRQLEGTTTRNVWRNRPRAWPTPSLSTQ